MKIFLFIAILSLCLNVSGQNDTVYIIKHDTIFMENQKDERYSMYLEKAETNTDRIWKVNLADVTILRLNAGLEYRLGKNWSSDTYLSAGYHNRIFEQAYTDGVIAFEFGHMSTTIEQNLKYYYNLNRRRNLGKNAYGFRGNSVAISFIYNSINYNYSSSDNTTPRSSENLNLGLKYSIQRRFADVIYAELFAGAYYRWSKTFYPSTPFEDRMEYSDYPLLTFGIRIGLGFNALRDLKSEFPY